MFVRYVIEEDKLTFYSNNTAYEILMTESENLLAARCAPTSEVGKRAIIKKTIFFGFQPPCPVAPYI